MRRVLVIIVTALLVGSMSGSATADRSLKVRMDPNDVPGAARDIRSVTSDLSNSHVYLAIRMWGGFRLRSRPNVVVDLDISGSRRFDRAIEVTTDYTPGTLRCVVWVSGVEHLEEFLGFRRASRPNRHTMACTLPRSWFTGIHRAVRFVVRSAGDGPLYRTDRAPDEGRYHWL